MPCTREHFYCPYFYLPVSNIHSKHISWWSPSLCAWLSVLGIHLTYHKVPNRRNRFGTRPRSSFRTQPGTLFLSTGDLRDVSALGEGRPLLHLQSVQEWEPSGRLELWPSVHRPELEITARKCHLQNPIATWKMWRTQCKVPVCWTMKDQLQCCICQTSPLSTRFLFPWWFAQHRPLSVCDTV